MFDERIKHTPIELLVMIQFAMAELLELFNNTPAQTLQLVFFIVKPSNLTPSAKMLNTLLFVSKASTIQFDGPFSDFIIIDLFILMFSM